MALITCAATPRATGIPQVGVPPGFSGGILSNLPDLIVSCEFLNARDAAHRLGVSVTTFYDWLGQSDRGLLRIRGQRATIEYFQGGPVGQGRIQIEPGEIDRIRELMRVRTLVAPPRRPPIRRDAYPGITVPLGLPGAR